MAAIERLYIWLYHKEWMGVNERKKERLQSTSNWFVNAWMKTHLTLKWKINLAIFPGHGFPFQNRCFSSSFFVGLVVRRRWNVYNIKRKCFFARCADSCGVKWFWKFESLATMVPLISEWKAANRTRSTIIIALWRRRYIPHRDGIIITGNAYPPHNLWQRCGLKSGRKSDKKMR